MKHLLVKSLLLLLPLALTPLWGYLLTEGIINLGGGEKDLLVLIPYVLWCLLYLVAGFFLRKHSTRKMLFLALLYSFSIILVIWLGVLEYSHA